MHCKPTSQRAHDRRNVGILGLEIVSGRRIAFCHFGFGEQRCIERRVGTADQIGSFWCTLGDGDALARDRCSAHVKQQRSKMCFTFEMLIEGAGATRACNWSTPLKTITFVPTPLF